MFVVVSLVRRQGVPAPPCENQAGTLTGSSRIKDTDNEISLIIIYFITLGSDAIIGYSCLTWLPPIGYVDLWR